MNNLVNFISHTTVMQYLLLYHTAFKPVKPSLTNCYRNFPDWSLACRSRQRHDGWNIDCFCKPLRPDGKSHQLPAKAGRTEQAQRQRLPLRRNGGGAVSSPEERNRLPLMSMYVLLTIRAPPGRLWYLEFWFLGRDYSPYNVYKCSANHQGSSRRALVS